MKIVDSPSSLPVENLRAQLNSNFAAAIQENDREKTRKIFQLLNAHNYVSSYHFEATASKAAANGDHLLAKIIWTALQQRLLKPSDRVASHIANIFLVHKNLNKAREVVDSIQDKHGELYTRFHMRLLVAEHKPDELFEAYRNIPDSQIETKTTALNSIAALIQAELHSASQSTSTPSTTTADDESLSFSKLKIAEGNGLILSELQRLNIRPTAEMTRSWIRSIKTLQDAANFMAYSANVLGHPINLKTLEIIIKNVEGPQLGLVWQLTKMQSLLGHTTGPDARITLRAAQISAKETDPVLRCTLGTILMEEHTSHWNKRGSFATVQSMISYNQSSSYAACVKAALPDLRSSDDLIYFLQKPARALLNLDDRSKFLTFVQRVRSQLAAEIDKFKKENEDSERSPLYSSLGLL